MGQWVPGHQSPYEPSHVRAVLRGRHERPWYAHPPRTLRVRVRHVTLHALALSWPNRFYCRAWLSCVSIGRSALWTPWQGTHAKLATDYPPTAQEIPKFRTIYAVFRTVLSSENHGRGTSGCWRLPLNNANASRTTEKGRQSAVWCKNPEDSMQPHNNRTSLLIDCKYFTLAMQYDGRFSSKNDASPIYGCLPPLSKIGSLQIQIPQQISSIVQDYLGTFRRRTISAHK
eukprot:scaffold68740_cov20-Prasinocladus_malaysianus.AAC.1